MTQLFGLAVPHGPQTPSVACSLPDRTAPTNSW
jgi:hypothetical protein